MAARTIFLAVHSGLPREGPGSRSSTARALHLAGALPENARILDIGCGPGAQTLDLAQLMPAASIVAVDADGPYVDEARRRVDAAGLTDRVTIARADMRALTFDDESFDLILCEGAVYIMGVSHALESWRRLLKPGGRIAFTENVWLRVDLPGALRTWWLNIYPDMADAQTCRDRVAGAGYRVLGDFVLPDEAWRNYYDPMDARIEGLAGKYEGDMDVRRALDECRLEIDTYNRHSDCYGYLFVVAAC